MTPSIVYTNSPIISTDHLLSSSGHLKFPENLQSETSVSSVIDYSDIVNMTTVSNNTQSTGSNTQYDLTNEGSYIKHIILNNHPNISLIEGAVGSLEDSDNEQLVNESLQYGVVQHVDSVILDALRLLSYDPAMRKLQSSLDVETVLVDQESEKYRIGTNVPAGGVKANKQKLRHKRKPKVKKQKQKTSKREKTSPASQKLLKDWLFSHSTCPYPSDDEKELLCLNTGLSLQQLNNWFINARRRILPNYLKQKDQ